MDKSGQTIAATEFASLTGVSRERLRTWERRFGFPLPRRSGDGPRRYALTDAARVVAVRRAAEQGVPLARAIEASGVVAETPAVADATLAAVVEHAPTPTLIVAGPTPLQVLWANGPLRAFPADDAAGQPLDGLPWFAGSDLERTLKTLFSSNAPALECAHPAWNGGSDRARSLAWRLPIRDGEPPTVALVGIDRAQDRRTRRELVETRRELRALRRREQRQERWLALAAALAERFQHEAGDAVLATTADTLVRRLSAVDAGIAVYMAGELALGSSSRALLGPRMVTVTGYADLTALMQAGQPGWLSPAAGGAFGAPGGLHSLAVPITVVGETLGMLLLVFDEPTELDDDARQLLTVVSAGLGFTLLRDRLVESSKG
ncbi:MerR family transcriptional regulator [Conexibacter sp. JD483]|uniref:MerR family transcriptional regulator n=1 Tax=unclassified Conexibacter TaxID=2627773 RepID=UPI0027264B4B|nr:MULTISPECIES: MerR family transcriptional regulator [unclassified Conexibacter]MDO8188868.1 MerR family transcriptional regulator [Conexibacter sp. CPCC 205706]MDO8200446.1 MerR family transcriptional regulator [Conexibacter sp. CPCC 205762]MDR9372595.1 MerR family transcriptional regulator [Conexibacter sp. JD483]